ncbi:MAG: Ribosomal RNA large subunit methyltransferase I [Candidatus Magasanikbacteria bacterium GW2011_GWC2_37_14]|uniref:Ribosomal RNA large subunit methyltransferase I n=1 Tax=Candidatus Magasanikbacteria bacterium GW2011_GWC2_37_14 TaxID=1619046 RepID=A0A0G0GCU7_9BACT|nr:MAG: Ribosomal RNA large subunit methyltransferase I [Candidatus Magasanikbacteria bacterium GW2011_GWC2_37_14]
MNKTGIVLKPGRDKAIKNKHHWIFSGAVSYISEFSNGEILPVYNSTGELLGHAYCNKNTSILGRMISFGNTDPVKELEKNLESAIAMRKSLFNEKITNCYRLVNSEGDNIPGLIIDKYAGVLVIQSATAGIDLLKPQIVEFLVKKLKPVAIYEKSDLSSRREEGLTMSEGLVYGKEVKNVEVIENGLKFVVDLVNSQKTGFFLDQREMRVWAGELAKNKSVLNCFAYTGGFSLYAVQGGAKQVDTVDISSEAIQRAEENFKLNGFLPPPPTPSSGMRGQFGFITADIFEFLRAEKLNYDLIILDPPAFAKKKTDVIKACRGYKDINRLALQKMPAGSILITSSCSYHVDEKLFQTVVFQAAVEANRKVRIIGRHHLAPDHPINIFHPEGEYLKSLVLYIE